MCCITPIHKAFYLSLNYFFFLSSNSCNACSIPALPGDCQGRNSSKNTSTHSFTESLQQRCTHPLYQTRPLGRGTLPQALPWGAQVEGQGQAVLNLMPAQFDLVQEVQNPQLVVLSVGLAVQSPHPDLQTIVQHGMIVLLFLKMENFYCCDHHD